MAIFKTCMSPNLYAFEEGDELLSEKRLTLVKRGLFFRLEEGY